MENKNIALNLDPQFGSDGHRDPFIQDEKTLSIAQLIPKIIAERGSFLNVTEDSLNEEIGILQTDQFSPSFSDEAEEQFNESNKKSHEEFLKQRNEVIQLMNSAYNETALSLDFISLLVSSVKPSNGALTMSPHLKQFVPSGSLNSSQLKMDPVTYDPKLGQGWKQESLGRVSESLRSASVRLNEEVLKEIVYWNRINEVLQNDEVLFKTRDQNTRAIGVKYGFGDAGSKYHDKGIALLRKEPGGNVTFKPAGNGNVEKVFRTVRVRILNKIDDDFVLYCQSSIKKVFNEVESIKTSIEKARFFLFEEELFYQLITEAAGLMSFGVQINSNKIIIEVNNELIEIESIAQDSEIDSNYIQTESDNKRAEYIASFLRLMLCAYHKSQLDLKQNVPTVSNKQRQENSRPLLLRSLLGHIKHQGFLNQISKIMHSLFDKYEDNFKVSLKKFDDLAERDIETKPFIRATTPPSSKFSILLINPKSQVLKINLHIVSTSSFCNLVVGVLIIKYDNVEQEAENRNGANVLSVDFTNLRETEDCLQWITTKFMEGADSLA